MLNKLAVAVVALFAASALHCTSGPEGAAEPDVVSLATGTGAAAVPVIECLTPANLTAYSLAGPTVKVDVTWSTNATADLSSGALALAWYDSSDVALGIKKTTTPVSYDLDYGEHLLTLALVTPDGALLPTPTARCSVRVRVTQSCAAESECADDFFCNVNVCDGALCKFGPTTEAACCQHDFECPYGQHCDAAVHTCIACLTDAHCDDANACTTDTCSGGLCEHAQGDPTCCDCNAVAAAGALAVCDDGKSCTVGACDCETNTCTFTPKPTTGGACCETGDDGGCSDGNPCTTDLCIANVCRNALQLPGMTACCTKDTDCNDGNVCTTDACDLGQNACTFVPTGGEGCCTTAAQCDDGKPDTLDACIASQCIHTIDVSYCTVPEQSDVVINELMVNPGAVSDTTGEWIELYNATAEAIDLSGWSLAELGAASVPVVLSPTAPLVIAPKGFLVLCRNGDSSVNGGVTCGATYGDTYTLANDGDEVVLQDKAGAVVDEVDYDAGPNFPNPTGASIALVNPQHDNNLGARWKASTAATAGDAATPGAANDDVFELFVVAACHEKPGDDVCSTDTCIDNHCAHIAVEACCNTGDDCVGESPCDAGTCTDHVCSFTVVPAPTCCLTTDVCNDGLSCTVDVCIGNACRHGPEPTLLGTACCNTAADCGGGTNSCVNYTCSAATHTCSLPTFTGGADCCTKNTYPEAAAPAECDDGDPSTRDACKDYHCLYFPDPTYCEAQPGQGTNNCALDGDPCTDDACDVATKKCKLAPVADCCAFSPNCDDGNPCTDDTCSPKDSACVHIPLPGCCLSTQPGTCDDGNACTTDACVSAKPLPGNPGVSVGRCRSSPVAGCCSTDVECDDHNACTVDGCNIVQKSCLHTTVQPTGGKLCCDPNDLTKDLYEQCDDGDPCSSPSCVGNLCVYTDVPQTAFGKCCDAATPDKGASQCNDNDDCTTDACVFGRCRNLGSSGSCCTTDAQCDDKLACTTDACVKVGLNQQCTHTPQSALCDDGKWCNGVESCEVGKGCAAGVAPIGLDDGIDCTDDVCIEAGKQLVHNPIDGYCDDGKACNGIETCEVALDGCMPGNGNQLDDGNPCTDDSCDDVTQEPVHVPNDAYCNDLLVCTSDLCDLVQGCVSTLLPAWCLIDDVCWVQGAVNPKSACQTCDTAKSPTAWSTKASTTETCNGVDDDCDGKTDEDAAGATLTQPCPNACGQIGLETCKGGAYADCSAPKVKEVCADLVDNDCDGTTDEEACAGFKPGVPGCDLKFSATLGQVENIVTDVGDGTYTTGVQDLANPNTSGTTTADAYGNKSAGLGFSVVALPPASLEVISLRETLYVDNAEARFAVAVRDLSGRPPKTGTAVSLSIAGSLPGAGTGASCSTDASGRCTLTWLAPAGAFTTGAGGQLFATITVGSVPAITKTLTVVGKPASLNIASPGAGLELPLSPRFPDSTFQVPVYLAFTAGAVGAYDIQLNFDATRLQAISAVKGACSAFDDPTHNIGAGTANDANKIGQVKLIGISNDLNGNTPCQSGAKIHVAVVTFKVLAALTPDTFAAGAAVTGVLNELDDVYISPQAQGSSLEIADMNGESFKGTVYAWSRATMGILASVPDAQLLNWQPITGAADTTQMAVIAYRRDFTSGSVAGDALTTYGSTNAQAAQVSASGLVTTGSGAGAATVTATYLGLVSAAQLRVLQPAPLIIELSDTDLQPIQNAPGGLFETAVVRAKQPWTDGAATVWTQDITPIFKKAAVGNATVEVPAGVVYDDTKAVLASSTAGSYTVKLKGAGGNVLGSATLKVSPGSPVTCKSLQMLAPCDVQMLSMTPSGPSAQLGKSTAEAGVYAYLKKYLQSCQVQTYGQMSDGTRMLMTGNAGLNVASLVPSIASSSATGLLTALSGGQADLTGAWQNGATTLCTGTTSVLVDLPKPTSIVVTPDTSTIAISGSDPAATVKGLPTSQALTVKVLYADGTASDFTTNAATVYDAKTADPSDLLVASPNGLATSTGNGAGTAQVKVSVSLYPGLAAATATIHVVKASGIVGEVYEPYTPAPPRVSDHIFSYIELTKTWQDGTYEVIMSFSDGSTLDVTKGTIVSTYKPGTATTNNAVVKLDPVAGHVQAMGEGIVDLVFDNGALTYKLAAFTVDKNNENIALLVPKAKSGTTFSGIKDKGTTQVETWCVFNDGTRRRLDGGNFVAGLLTFKSTVTKAATVDAMGLATIRGNFATIFQVDISSGVDKPPAYDPPAEAPVDANLLPDCGDIDVGDEVGLAFKDQNPGATFTLGVRVNTCDNALGAFDVDMSYDPAVLDATSADADGATVGAIFSSNTQSTPGHIYANASFNPLGGIKKGANLVLMKVFFKAKKTGSTISAMGGNLKKVVAIDAKTPIGPATPRPFVAGEGLLDPYCNGVVPGDVDGDCDADAADVRLVLEAVATHATCRECDVDGDGTVTLRDAGAVGRLAAR